jgi:N-acyl homoserine lactone hydrolase
MTQRMSALRGVWSAVAAAMIMGVGASAQDVPLRLTTFDCGAIDVSDLNIFSDTDAYTGMEKTLSVPCFLIEHGDQKLLFDLGLPDSMAGTPLVVPGQALHVERTLAAQLDELGIAPDDIDLIAVSHGHLDHAGNVNMFPNATLIVQQAEWNAIFNGGGGAGPMDPALFSEFADGENVQLVTGDYDIFGDGSVVTLFTPGHTPGHQALLVRLKNAGPVILSGDWAHFTENRVTRGVPDFNWNRADTLASMDRLEGLATNLGARIIIEHEPDDIATLPAFPEALD